MTAGTGVTHSEYNASRDTPVHLLQIWILPDAPNLPPSYEQRDFGSGEMRERLRLVASRDGRDGSLVVHQDVALHLGRLAAGAKIRHAAGGGSERLGPGRARLPSARRRKARGGRWRRGDGLAGASSSKPSSPRTCSCSTWRRMSP